MEKHNEQQIAEYKEIFNIFDQNKDGYIKSSELGNMMRLVGCNPTEAEVKKLMQCYDKNNNGTIEFDEFITMLSSRKQEDSINEEDLINAFRSFDKDQSGQISKTELKNVLVSMGEKLGDDEAEELVLEADVDGDGMINYEEFVKMITG